MVEERTQRDTLDEMLQTEEFFCIGQFKKSEVERIIGDVLREEGGSFKTYCAFKDNGNTPKKNWLRLYHQSKNWIYTK